MAENPPVEVKSAADDAWFEAALEIDPSNPSQLVARVPFLEDDEGEVVKKGEVLTRVRFPSEQVHDKDCGSVTEGQSLCCLNNTATSSRYFEAEVLKVQRLEHVTKGGHEVCQCEFLVKWSQGPDKGETSVVGCECLCKVSVVPIDTHPLVAKVLAS